MVTVEQGTGGAGNKLKVDIDDVVNYGIGVLNIQMIITSEGVPRYDRGQEKRVWIMYKKRPIIEFGVDEIRYAMQVDKNRLNTFEQDTIIGINSFISNYNAEIKQLMK